LRTEEEEAKQKHHQFLSKTPDPTEL